MGGYGEPRQMQRLNVLAWKCWGLGNSRIIADGSNAAPWIATFVYGEPRVENRKDMWDLMRFLYGEWLSSWTLIGDSNEAMWQYAHFSRTPCSERQIVGFQEALSHCNLYDLDL